MNGTFPLRMLVHLLEEKKCGNLYRFTRSSICLFRLFGTKFPVSVVAFIVCEWVKSEPSVYACVLNFCSLISLAVRLCLHMQKGFHINISPNLRSKWTYVFNFFLSFRSCCCFPASFFHRPMALDICVRHRWVGKKATRRTMFNIVIYTLFWSNWPYIVELYFICCYIC